MFGPRQLVLRSGIVAGCAFAALVLLAGFYSIVSGAVDRAARHRLAATEGMAVVSAPASRATSSSHRLTLLSRADN